MLSRWMCIVTLILMCLQILLAGAMLAPTLGALHAAWLVQDRLVLRLSEVAYRRWPFGWQRGMRRPRSRGAKRKPRAWPVADPSALLEPLLEMELEVQEVAGWEEELAAYNTAYEPLFGRREQREWGALYLQGLLLNIPNKSIEALMLALVGADTNAIRAMQHFIGAGAWADATLLRQHWSQVDQMLGDRQGVYILDGSEFLKQGQESVGVKRQRCGEVGKVANCQAGVFLGYASSHGYTLLDRRLYLPREWVEADSHAERRETCGVPEDITFQTKAQLGREMLQTVRQTDTLRGRWLTCDEAFGRDTAFLDGVAQQGLCYFAEVPHDTRAWRQRPATAVPAWSGRGRQPKHARLVAGEPEPQDVVTIAQSLPAAKWSRHTIKQGSKGPIVADFAALPVVTVRDGLPGPQVWLVLRRHLKTQELKTYLCNAPANTPFVTLVRLSGQRWPIERCFEESKQHLGMRDYQVRSWHGWHHHMTLCILAHFFLMQLKRRLKPRAPALTLPQLHLLIAAVLPQRSFDAQWALEVVTYRQKRNHAAYLSHCRRRLALLNHLE